MTPGIPVDISLAASAGPGSGGSDSKRAVSAAKDFEALLIGQMLRSVREGGSGWLGTGESEGSDAALSLGEEQLAKAMAAGGGLGLSKVIAAELAPRSGDRQMKSEP